MISEEASAIYQSVKDQIERNRDDLNKVEASLEELLTGGKPKKKRGRKPQIGNMVSYLGEDEFDFDFSDSDSASGMDF